MQRQMIHASLIVALSCSLTTTALAAPIAYDGFESYTAGASINGQGTSGGGWAGAWSVTFGNNLTVINGGGLSYSNGSVNINGGDKALQMAAANTTANRPFTSTSPDPLYFSFLMTNAAGLDTDDYFGLSLSNNTDAGSTYAAMGKMASAKAGIRLNNFTNGESSTSITTGTVYMLVGRLSTDATTVGDGAGNYDRLELWVNPTSATLGTPDAVLNNNMGTTPAAIAYVFVRGNNIGTGDAYVMDELRLGTDAASVIPIPEPASLVLMMAGILAMVHRPRRRACL